MVIRLTQTFCVRHQQVPLLPFCNTGQSPGHWSADSCSCSMDFGKQVCRNLCIAATSRSSLSGVFPHATGCAPILWIIHSWGRDHELLCGGVAFEHLISWPRAAFTSSFMTGHAFALSVLIQRRDHDMRTASYSVSGMDQPHPKTPTQSR